MKDKDFVKQYHASEYEAWKYPGYIHHTIDNPPEPKVYALFNGKYVNVEFVTEERGNIIIHLLEE